MKMQRFFIPRLADRWHSLSSARGAIAFGARGLGICPWILFPSLRSAEDDGIAFAKRGFTSSARRRERALLGAFCALFVVISPAIADTLDAKEAIRVMTKAGYAGIGGVTHDDHFYYAAALDAKRRRVRVTLDDRSGKIVAVVPLKGAGTPLAVQREATPGSKPVHIGVAPIKPLFPPYQPIKPPHPVGVIQYPFKSNGQLQPGWCRFHANAPGC